MKTETKAERKFIKELIKDYNKSECYICGDKKELIQHYFYPPHRLWYSYKKNKQNPKENEFKEQFSIELDTKPVTLCIHHKKRLNKLFGPVPSFKTVVKQKQWIDLTKRQL